MPELRKLEADFYQLADAFNQNSQVFSHGLTVAEMRLRVIERSMHDQLRGCVRTTEIDGLAYVDFDSYVTEFAMCMLMTEFAAWLVSLSKEPPLVLVPSAEDALVFGGNP